MKQLASVALLAAALGTGLVGTASAQELKIGVTLSTTGPAAALGIPMRNALAFWPETIGGLKVVPVLLDDEGDPSKATTNGRRLVTEDKVDVLAGSSTTPPTLALGNVARDAGVPHFALGPMPLGEGRDKWSVVVTPPVNLLGKQMYAHMLRNGVKTVALIGFSDSWGDLWLRDFKAQGEKQGLTLVTDERYARADTSVAGQALKIVAAKPDAVIVAASGTAAALPQTALRERGFKGLIYQTPGAVSYDFVRVAGKAAEGVILSSGPVMVSEQLADNALTKKPGMAFNAAYETKHGANTRTQFAAQVNDMIAMLQRIVPVALKTAKPGTPEFREALRQALNTEREIVGTQGVYNFTEQDRFGIDDRAVVLLTVKDGKFTLAPAVMN